MAKIVDNPKRFKVIELSRNELAKIGGIGICDRCNGTSNAGYYVAVLNCWFCPKCYNVSIHTPTQGVTLYLITYYKSANLIHCYANHHYYSTS